MEKPVAWSHSSRAVRAAQGQSALHLLEKNSSRCLPFLPRWGPLPFPGYFLSLASLSLSQESTFRHRDLGVGESTLPLPPARLSGSPRRLRPGREHCPENTQPCPGRPPPRHCFVECCFPHLIVRAAVHNRESLFKVAKCTLSRGRPSW